MARPWQLTVRRRRRIAKLYERGLPVAMLAFTFDISPQYPGQIARDYGMPMRRPDLADAKRRAP